MNWQLIALALEAALYPTLLAAVVILLSQPRRVQLLGAYLAGGLTISIGVGLLFVFVLKGSRATSGGSHTTFSWGVDLAVGGLALLVAVALATRQDERLREHRRARHELKHPPAPEDEHREPWTTRILAGGSTPLVFLAALAINVPGAAYLVGLKDIAAAHNSTARDLFQIVGFNAIMFLLAEVPLVGLLVAPDPTVALVERVNAWFSRNGRTIAMVLAAALGFFLIARGIKNS